MQRIRLRSCSAVLTPSREQATMQGIRLGRPGAGVARVRRAPGGVAVAGVTLGEGRRPAVAGRTRCPCPGRGPRRPAGRGAPAPTG